MKIEMRKTAIQEKSILCNLWELYLYDFSEMNNFDVDDSGRYGGTPDQYWTDPQRHPFLIYADGKLAGFVLVSQKDHTNSIGQFFVMRKYRRQGVGREVAFRIFDIFCGKWKVGVTTANVDAQAFWRKVIGRYTEGRFKEEIDESGIDFFFENTDRSNR